MEHLSHNNHPPNSNDIRDNITSSTNSTIPLSQSPDALSGQTVTTTATTTLSNTRTYLDVYAHPSLPRVDSTASFVAEACHIEDVNAGCQLHSHPSDIALSRYTVVHGVLLREGQVRPGTEEGRQQYREYSNDGKRDSQAMEMTRNSRMSPRSPTIMTRTPTPPSPPTSNMLEANPSASVSRVAVPPISQHPSKPASQGPSSLFPPPPPHQKSSATSPSGSNSPQHTSIDLNWGLDDRSELFTYETGQSPWQDVFGRANTPPVPPDVVSKPQSELSSDEDDQKLPDSETRPLFGGNGNHRGVGGTFYSNETTFSNSILHPAAARLPGDESQSVMLGPTVTSNSAATVGSSLLGNMGGKVGTHTSLEKDDLPDLCVREGLPPLAIENELVDEVPPTNQNVETTTTAITPITTTDTTSLFDEPRDYEGSDFFSHGTAPPSYGSEWPTDSGTLIIAQPREGGQTGASVFGLETVDSTISGGAEFLANPVQSAAGQGIVDSDQDAMTVDIAAKWEAVLDVDFLPDDGEGFLSSDEEIDTTIPAAPQSSRPLATVSQLTPSKYTPQQFTAPPIHSQGPYQPSQPSYILPAPAAHWQSQPSPHLQSTVPQSAQYSQSHPSSSTSTASLTPYYASTSTSAPRSFNVTTPLESPLLPPSTVSKAESFVNKEGSYKSPYDLPMDIVKPVLSKRASIPHMYPTVTSPPRQSSFGATPPPMMQGAFGPSLHRAQSGLTPPPPPHLPTTVPKVSSGAKSGFFEELPIVTKPKPPTRYHSKALVGTLPQPVTTTALHSPSAPSPQPASAEPTALHLINTRYAPPPNIQASNRTTPVYTFPPSAPGPVFPPQHSILASAPETSDYTSPPASAPGVGSHQSPPRQRLINTPPCPSVDRENVASQHHSPSLARYPLGDHHLHSSRPGTGKSSFTAGFEALREEDEVGAPARTMASNRYSQRTIAIPPSSGPPLRGISRVAGHFSPPTGTNSQGIYSLHQQSSSRTASPESFTPPRRAQTTSPSTLIHGSKSTAAPNQALQNTAKPASALAGNQTPMVYPDFSSEEQHHCRLSGGVKNFVNDAANFMPPQDDSVNDPLNRWQGCPIFSWGFGGNVVMMFPTRTQRNAVGMSRPVIKCSPGEVRIRQFRDVLPVEENLTKFPGPVYTGGRGTKAKKKEVLAWITDRIQSLESHAADLAMFLPGEKTPDERERKRREEKVLLWKGMRIFLENDGIVEGAEIEKSIKSFLLPEDPPSQKATYQLVTSMNNISMGDGLGLAPGLAPGQVDADAMKTIKAHLLNGNRTSAVWHAVDKRLWSHAMLMAGTVSKDLWKQVVQDFVKTEIKALGSGYESLAVLYEVFGGNGEESIDELVPPSARLGQPMMTSAMGTVVAKDPQQGLEMWREALALIISNRSVGDTSAILSLGKLLGTYARVDASHLCYLFAKTPASFSGSDDPNAAVTLFGADHLCYPYTFWKDVDAVLLSEVYELALSLTPSPHAAPVVIPHLQGIKLYHTLLLAESGYRTEAQKYCEAIGSVLKSSNTASPYFHRTMFNALEELTNRLSQSPKDITSGGWRLDNISGSMWGAFTKFVAGEESNSLSGLDGGVTSSGPVSGQYGSSVTGMSRPQSSVDMYASYAGITGASGGKYSPTSSKQYHPMTTYPHTQISYAAHPPSSGNLYDPSPSYSPFNPVPNAHNPVTLPSSAPQSPYTGTPAHEGGYISLDKLALRSNLGTSSSHQVSSDSSFQDVRRIDDKVSGHQPLSYVPTATYSYEPPKSDAASQPTETSSTFQENEPDGETPKPKQKSFLDDNDDDADFLARVAELKEEEEKKKKQEEESKKQTATSGGGRWFSSWFSKKDPSPNSGPIKAKLGEENSFYYDPELKRWVNKKAASEDPTSAKATPPPPKHPPRPGSAAAPPPTTSLGSPLKSQSVPPSNTAFPPPIAASGSPSTPIPTAPPMRVGTPSGPPVQVVNRSAPNTPSRLGTPTLSKSSTPASLPTSVPPPPGPSAKKQVLSRSTTAVGGDILDDLMGGPAGPRKGPGSKKGKKGSRYVDVMAK